jgi:hypothetical protein
MKNKILRLSILVCFVCFLISCQLLSNNKTPTPVYLVATAQQPTSIPAFFSDDFSTDQNSWAIGDFPGEFADSNYQIKNGLYVWTIKSHKIANERTWPEMDALSDFTVTVDARQKSDNVDECDYGILYRDPTDKSLLSFTVSNQQFSVYSYNETDNWVEVIPWTDSTAIAPGEFNQMKVTASNGEYSFMVNDQELTTFNYSKISTGQLGLNVDVFPADTTCEFEFDNFQVTTP